MSDAGIEDTMAKTHLYVCSIRQYKNAMRDIRSECEWIVRSPFMYQDASEAVKWLGRVILKRHHII